MEDLRYDAGASYPVRSYDVEYRHEGHRAWLAHVWQPEALVGDGPFPALIEVHGGAWEKFDRMRDADIIEPLAASGLVIVAVDFHSSHEAPYPASIADINYATRWLKANAERFNASSEQIGGLGISSGGHQLLLSAMRPHDSRYNSIPLPDSPDHDAGLAYLLTGWVPIDPLNRYLNALEQSDKELLDATLRYFLDEEGMRDGNPQLILERGESVETPPVLLVQGANDKFIMPGVPERFVQSYAQAGGLIELAKYPGEPHAFMRHPSANTDRALALMKSFIARCLSEESGARK
jgi:acetyl esterase